MNPALHKQWEVAILILINTSTLLTFSIVKMDGILLEYPTILILIANPNFNPNLNLNPNLIPNSSSLQEVRFATLYRQNSNTSQIL